MAEEYLIPVTFILICTIIISVGYLLYRNRKQGKYYKKILDKLTEKNNGVKPEQYEGRWQDPNHPIISGKGGKGWEDQNHPIMR